MSDFGNWLASILEGPTAPALIVTKLTAILAVAWLIHCVLSHGNPRWRVLIWRSAASGVLILIVLACCPPFFSLPLLPPEPLNHAEEKPLQTREGHDTEPVIEPIIETSSVGDRNATDSSASVNLPDRPVPSRSMFMWLCIIWFSGLLIGAIWTTI